MFASSNIPFRFISFINSFRSVGPRSSATNGDHWLRDGNTGLTNWGYQMRRSGQTGVGIPDVAVPGPRLRIFHYVGNLSGGSRYPSQKPKAPRFWLTIFGCCHLFYLFFIQFCFIFYVLGGGGGCCGFPDVAPVAPWLRSLGNQKRCIRTLERQRTRLGLKCIVRCRISSINVSYVNPPLSVAAGRGDSGGSCPSKILVRARESRHFREKKMGVLAKKAPFFSVILLA